jgi:hypothetical protein
MPDDSFKEFVPDPLSALPELDRMNRRHRIFSDRITEFYRIESCSFG